MMWLLKMLATLFAPSPLRSKPCDLVAFEEARRRLRERGREVSRAVTLHVKEADDAIGWMATEMRGARSSCNKASPKASVRKKKRPKKSC